MPIKIRTFFREMWSVLLKNELMFNSSAITFNLLLCSIPFTLLMTSIIGFILRDEAAILQITRLMNDFLPAFFTSAQDSAVNIEGVIIDLLRPLIDRRRVYGILGFSILSFTSLGLFTAIKHVLFKTFEIQEKKNPLSKMIYNFFAFGLVGGVFIFFTAAVSLYSIITIKTVQIPGFNLIIDLGWLSNVLAVIIPIVFNLSLFYIFFRYGSERIIRRRVCLFGASFYVVLFETAKYLFGLYLSYFYFQLQSIYHGYSILLMLGFWAFYGAIIFVLSVIAAKAFNQVLEQHPPATATTTP